MLISTEIYNQLCPEYQRAVDELEMNLKDADDNEERHMAFKEFYDNYFMIKDLWDLRAQFEWFSSLEEDTLGDASYHFYYDRQCTEYITNQKIFYSFETLTGLLGEEAKTSLLPKDSELLRRARQCLNYPHYNLQRDLKDYIACCSSLPPTSLIKRVKDLTALAKRIMEAEDTFEKWITCLREFDDEEFVRHNIQDRIAWNPLNKDLWKAYIKYLEEVNPREMLETYSRYCRLFLDDVDMKFEYKTATEKYGSDVSNWNDLFDFEEAAKEFHWEKPEANDQDEKMDIQAIESVKPPTRLYPPSLINSMISQADPWVLRKLHKCSKTTLAKHPYPTCHRLLGREHCDNKAMDFFEDSVKIFDYPWEKRRPPRKIHLATWLNIMGYEKQNILSKLIQNYIYKCDATYIHIIGQKLTEAEFDFLVGHGNVHSLDLFEVPIQKDDGNLLTVAEIIKKVPKVQRFEITGEVSKLSELPFASKLHHFILHEPYEDPIDMEDVFEFLKKFAAPFSTFTLYYDGFHFDYVGNLEKQVKEFQKTWCPQIFAPNLKLLDWTEES